MHLVLILNLYVLIIDLEIFEQKQLTNVRLLGRTVKYYLFWFCLMW
jgi:hypothetical protein